MADSADETFQGDDNEERRLCGLARNDVKDDMREEAEELFRRNIQAPINVDDGAAEGGIGN